MATAFLFRELFAVTGPVSRYLQTVDIDLSKAVPMINSSITSLQKMRNILNIFRLMADDVFGNRMENDTRSSPASTVCS